MQKLIRWGIAVVVAAVVYVIIQKVVPSLEGGISAISPMVLTLNTSLLATAAGVILGGFLVPRAHLPLARKVFFALGILAPIGLAVWDYFHGGLSRNYLGMLGGAFAGGMVGLFILILPKPQRQVQPRRFN